jgi:hypothetical protein
MKPETSLSRPTLEELSPRCQKPDHRTIGNWMARRIARPAALGITWVVAPWGVSPSAATLIAWGFAIAASAVFAWGTVWGWMLGAGLLHLWYLLDHVDGQLARLRGTSSLDGAQLDYLMHHTVNLIVPVGVGLGLFCRTAQSVWLLAGLAWGISLQLVTLQHDARYKAFVQRLKRLHGELCTVGGGGGRPVPQPPVPRRPTSLAIWSARKLCEVHVIVNMLSVIALAQLVLRDSDLTTGRLLVAVAGSASMLVAIGTIVRSQTKGLAEREFAMWYRVPENSDLVFADGWWHVCPGKPEEDTHPRQDLDATVDRSRNAQVPESPPNPEP